MQKTIDDVVGVIRKCVEGSKDAPYVAWELGKIQDEYILRERNNGACMSYYMSNRICESITGNPKDPRIDAAIIFAHPARMDDNQLTKLGNAISAKYKPTPSGGAGGDAPDPLPVPRGEGGAGGDVDENLKKAQEEHMAACTVTELKTQEADEARTHEQRLREKLTDAFKAVAERDRKRKRDHA